MPKTRKRKQKREREGSKGRAELCLYKRALPFLLPSLSPLPLDFDLYLYQMLEKGTRTYLRFFFKKRAFCSSLPPPPGIHKHSMKNAHARNTEKNSLQEFHYTNPKSRGKSKIDRKPSSSSFRFPPASFTIRPQPRKRKRLASSNENITI